MMTFKHFLENDELGDLAEIMCIRKLIPGLTTAEAKIVRAWYLVDYPSYDDLPDNISEMIANSKFAETDYAGQSLAGDADHIAAPLVGQKLKRVVSDYIKTGMLIHEEEDPLQDLQIELFFRKELDLAPSQAKYAVQWAKNEINSDGLPTDVWDYIIDWAAGEFKGDIWIGPQWALQDRVRATAVSFMQKKYGISL